MRGKIWSKKGRSVYVADGQPRRQVQRSVLSQERRWECVEGLRVLRATDEAGHWYTIKRFRVTHCGARRMLVSELNGLIVCPEHVAVVLCDAVLDGLEAVVVLDDGGGFYLRDVLEVRGRLPEQNASIVLRQVLAGLRHLHEGRVVHNDVDARNVLISPLGQARLCGFCYCALHTERPARRFAGPFVHMSPERLLGLDCGPPADVWSLGILALEILLGRGPHDMARFAGPDALATFRRAVVSEPSPGLHRGGGFSDDARIFVDACLHKNVKLRATAQVCAVRPRAWLPGHKGRTGSLACVALQRVTWSH
jgi:serine/threonine protein kinase